MKRLLFVLAIITLFHSCQKDEDSRSEFEEIISEDEISAPEIEIDDYIINNPVGGLIYPVRNYRLLNENEEIIVYGKYDELGNFSEITQLIYQNEQDHLELSFNSDKSLVSIANYDIGTNSLRDKILLASIGNAYFLSRNGDTQVIKRGDDFDLAPISGDIIDNELASVLSFNSELLVHLNGTVDSNSKNLSNAKGSNGIIVGALIVGISIVAIQSIGVKEITKGTRYESNDIEELLGKICSDVTSQKSNSLIFKSNNSYYSCNGSSELENERLKNNQLNPLLCEGNRICLPDCNGDIDGTAYLDECNECVGGNTGEEECIQDCNGDFGGTAYLDECNECVGGNTGKEECVQDCNGDYGGTAYFDECDECVGGNTGKEECVQDCNGDYGGTAYFDECDECVGGNTGAEACIQDCNGDFGGTAYLDDCNECVGGNTGKTECEDSCSDKSAPVITQNSRTCIENSNIRTEFNFSSEAGCRIEDRGSEASSRVYYKAPGDTEYTQMVNGFGLGQISGNEFEGTIQISLGNDACNSSFEFAFEQVDLCGKSSGLIKI